MSALRKISSLSQFFAEAQAPSWPISCFRKALAFASLVTAIEAVFLTWKVTRPGLLRLPVFDTDLSFPLWLPLVLGSIWIVAALLQITRRWFRPALGVALALEIVFLLFDQQLYSNHLYLLTWITALSLFLPTPPFSGNSPWWPVFLIQGQVSIAYFFAALAKCNVYYLSGALIWNSLDPWIRALPGSKLVFEPPVICGIAMLSIAVEFFLAIGLWFRKTCFPAAALGLGLHLGMLLLMHDLGRMGIAAFALICIGSYLLFCFARPGLKNG